MLKLIVCLASLVGAIQGARQIIVHNNCAQDIWNEPLTNNQGPQLGVGIVKIPHGGKHAYNIPDGGWGGRMWPKFGCNANGENCNVGQSVPPCGTNGCDAPADTKVEFNFAPLNGGDNWYDISLVDGYSRSARIVPSETQGSCKVTHCNVQLDKCPSNENKVGDLRLHKNGNVVACLSPCKKWNWPPPHGLGNPETQDPGLHFCCPTPPVSPQQCRTGPVVNTHYVNLIHKDCPTAYSYAYDDEGGLHNCPNHVSFNVHWCD